MKIEELKKVVEKATPGPWINGNDEDSCLFLVGPEDYPGLVGHPVVSLHDERNADYIATFNPSLVSKLLRVVEAATRLANVEFMGDEKNYQDEDIVMVSVGLVRETRAALRDLEQS